MEDKPPSLQTFFNYSGLMGLVLSLRTEVISSKPTQGNIVSLLYTFAYTYTLAILISITMMIVQIFYEKFVKPKIFKNDNTH